MKATVRMVGVDGMIRAINDISKGTPKAVMRSMEAKGAKRILKRTIPLTPKDTGALRASGAVYPVRAQGTRFSATVGFGGPGVRYALIQHEEMSYRHPVGQAKYLETGVKLEAGAARADLIADVVSAWKAGKR